MRQSALFVVYKYRRKEWRTSVQRLALLTLLAAGYITAATAQEEAESEAEAPVATEGEESSDETETEAEQDAEEGLDDSVLDDEFYQDAVDEDFRPSEDIPADQSIPFPTDI